MRKNRINFSKKITDWIGSTSSLVTHTIFFIGVFILSVFGVPVSDILLILTTIVSLEAIYLAIFIQITINQHSEDLEEVSGEIEELQEDVEGISEDVEEIQKDVEEINEDEDEEEKELAIEKEKFQKIENTLELLLQEINSLKSKKKKSIKKEKTKKIKKSEK